ncbi:hypothetical protein Bca52824_014533 [Brassica carinata]|uniref:Uncharacterized protein n=1 Tax=Brassica carinata TaxID=52824 RepID=A0A8X7TYW9_BRACI|nr:hypothetical protein Bca52824_078961 [Brassica carinata]KAG2321320.1 hypothetical protein Bca52824_014533 [Brassica carinata]
MRDEIKNMYSKHPMAMFDSEEALNKVQRSHADMYKWFQSSNRQETFQRHVIL